MALHTLYLLKPITDTQTRIWLGGGAHWLQRGMLIQIGRERMRLVRKHRDGSFTVDRGVMGTTTAAAHATDSGVGGDTGSFN